MGCMQSTNLLTNADSNFDTGVCNHVTSPRRNSDGNIIEIPGGPRFTTAGHERITPTPGEDFDSSEDFKEDQRYEMLMNQAKAELNGRDFRTRQPSWSLSSNSFNQMFLDSNHTCPSQTSATCNSTGVSIHRKFSVDRQIEDLYHNRQPGTTI